MSNFDLPATEAALENLLSEPTPALSESLSWIDGDIMVLGAGGKMGPSLARLTKRAAGSKRVVAVSRFSDQVVRDGLAMDGVETITADLLEPEALSGLPEVRNVIFMAGQKFGTSGDEARTWAINAYLPGLVAERFRGSRIVAFSTGNVYPLTLAHAAGPKEDDPVGPVGEYAQSALARERILTYHSQRYATPLAILRLNYAIEARYGVLRDIADKVWHDLPVDVTMGWVNVIWQRDANALALQCLERCAVPPFVLNLTGTQAFSVRWLAEEFARRMQKSAQIVGQEADTALLSNAARMQSLFGEPPFGIETIIDLVADWISRGGRSLGKATKFESREGRF